MLGPKDLSEKSTMIGFQFFLYPSDKVTEKAIPNVAEGETGGGDAGQNWPIGLTLISNGST